jgi:hypothetical protein
LQTTIHKEMEGLGMLESSVELLGDLAMSGVTLLIAVCIVGSTFATLRALRRGNPRREKTKKAFLL